MICNSDDNKTKDALNAFISNANILNFAISIMKENKLPVTSLYYRQSVCTLWQHLMVSSLRKL